MEFTLDQIIKARDEIIRIIASNPESSANESRTLAEFYSAEEEYKKLQAKMNRLYNSVFAQAILEEITDGAVRNRSFNFRAAIARGWCSFEKKITVELPSGDRVAGKISASGYFRNKAAAEEIFTAFGDFPAGHYYQIEKRDGYFMVMPISKTEV